MSSAMIVFLFELRSLLEKHEASIGSCGCCGSPWVTVGDETVDAHELRDPPLITPDTITRELQKVIE